MRVSYHRASSADRWSGHAAGREVPLIPRETLQTRGGPSRDLFKCMEVQLSKVGQLGYSQEGHNMVCSPFTDINRKMFEVNYLTG